MDQSATGTAAARRCPGRARPSADVSLIAPTTNGSQIRVASVPAAHPYVAHIAPLDTARSDVVRLDDPTDPWWPPKMLEPLWVSDHAEEFDLMHVHFGYDATDPDALTQLAHALEREGKPLVVTAHDLRNPHHSDPALHGRQLRVLLRHAAKAVTLTDHAAIQLAERFNVTAEVIAHPHIVPLDEMRSRQQTGSTSRTVIGLHFKSLRTNVETAVLDAAIRATAELGTARLRVDVHCDVAASGSVRHDASLMRKLYRAAARDELDLHVHDCFDDDEFFEYLASLRVSVLPYRFGTHSGWMEACRDLGTSVVAPDCGSYHDQGPVWSYRCNEMDGFDQMSCVDAIRDAFNAPQPPPVSWSARLDQRQSIARQHREIYAAALGR